MSVKAPDLISWTTPVPCHPNGVPTIRELEGVQWSLYRPIDDRKQSSWVVCRRVLPTFRFFEWMTLSGWSYIKYIWKRSVLTFKFLWSFRILGNDTKLLVMKSSVTLSTRVDIKNCQGILVYQIIKIEPISHILYRWCQAFIHNTHRQWRATPFWSVSWKAIQKWYILATYMV